MRLVVLWCLVILASMWTWAMPICVSTPDALIFQGTAMVPLRPMAELLGAELSFSADGNIFIRRDNDTLIYSPKSGALESEGRTLPCPIKPFILTDTYYFPLRALLESFHGTLAMENASYFRVTFPNCQPLIMPIKHQEGFPAQFYHNIEELYVVSVDGRGLRRLTYDTDVDMIPVFSPDGDAWVYRHGRSLILRKGNEPNPLVLLQSFQDSDIWDYSFSPDGGEIVCRRSNVICLVRRDGSGFRKLTSGRYPAFSPDGKYIAFNTGSRDTAGEVMLTTHDGTGLIRVGPGFFPQWGDNGHSLYVHQNDLYGWVSDGLQRYTFTNAETLGSAAQVIAGTTIRNTSITSDGQHLLFVKVGVNAGIYYSDVDGSNAQRITTNAEDYWPLMSPDGQRIAFYRDHALYCLTLTTRQLVKIAPIHTSEFYLGDAVFTPDSRAVIFVDIPIDDKYDLGL